MDDRKPAKKAGSADKLEFSGRLNSINVSGPANHFQFELVGKNGSNSYLLDSASPSGFATLAALVTSAYMAGKKIHVQATANGEGLPFASSVRIGAKPKVPKVKKAKPVKRVKGPVIEAQPAAA
ncbi:MAG: hypothetical protein IT541_05640 [Hyphomicrobiales bacterium]|nr:hypothetical protein [Hyphomicrobiales bacterium]